LPACALPCHTGNIRREGVLDRILLTNDDGIDAPGLGVLEAIARELAREIWIVAPEHDQSGVSHAISLHHPIRVTERGLRRYAVTGTPGDCAVMAASRLMSGAPPDLLLCGVNRGANLGVETVFSGTVGGAMTGVMLGIRSIALSQAWSDRAQIRWDAAAMLGPAVICRLLAAGWSARTCLSVNFPDLPPAEAGPLTLARQSFGLIQGIEVLPRTDPRGLTYYWVGFRHARHEPGLESDLEALAAGNVVVTPLACDRTDDAAYAQLREALAS
jgi:5'-nucleotidase